MSTYEGCCCCTYDLQHSPPWLLLLLLFVDQLVYITLYCSFVIAITQLRRLYDEHMLEAFRFFYTSDLAQSTNNMYHGTRTTACCSI